MDEEWAAFGSAHLYVFEFRIPGRNVDERTFWQTRHFGGIAFSVILAGFGSYCRCHNSI